MLQTQVNYWNYVENKRHNYAMEEANFQQARAALSQAESAARNADTNAYNALINKYNADINAQNARTNAQNAETNAYNAYTQRESAISNIALNTERMATEKSQQSLNLANQFLTEQKKETETFTTSIEGSEAHYRPEVLTTQIHSNKARQFESITGGVRNLVDGVVKLDSYWERHGL